MKIKIKDIKEYNDKLYDLFLDIDDDKTVYDDKTDDIIHENGETENVWDYIWNYTDESLYYYSTANEYLKDFDIFEEIKEFNQCYGSIPENECILASFVFNNELCELFNEAVKELRSL